MQRKYLAAFFVVTLFVAGFAQFGHALTIPAKAKLADYLIDLSWNKTLGGEADAKPWPWMDSAPVAKISVPRFEKDFVVMRGTSGTVLAFTPGWHDGTDFPGRPGISLISAHRDTHFSFIRHMEEGDEIILETAEGGKMPYVVEKTVILQDTEIKVSADDSEPVLLLSTCYPFSNWQAGGEMRFVVVAKPARGQMASSS